MKYKLGAQLRAIRKKRSLTGKKVADKAKLSTSLLSQIENNRISPSLDTLLKLLEVYGISMMDGESKIMGLKLPKRNH